MLTIKCKRRTAPGQPLVTAGEGALRRPLWVKSGLMQCNNACPLRAKSGSAMRPSLSAFALHRFVREPLELDPNRVNKGPLALQHYQASRILFRRNPPLGACATAPKELSSRVLMIERTGLRYQCSREAVSPASKSSESGKS